MKNRFLIFLILGPLIGFLVVRYGFLFSSVHGFEWQQIVLLPVIYTIGIVPAFIAALIDQAFAKRRFVLRPIWTGAVGFFAAFIPILASMLYFQLYSPFLLLWGLVGFIPAFVCSFLSRG